MLIKKFICLKIKNYVPLTLVRWTMVLNLDFIRRYWFSKVIRPGFGRFLALFTPVLTFIWPGHCNHKRLPCIVKEAIKKANHILYILQCKFGILEQGYLAKEIEMYLGTLEMPQPSLRSIQSQVLDQLLILLQSIRLI